MMQNIEDCHSPFNTAQSNNAQNNTAQNNTALINTLLINTAPQFKFKES